MTDFINSYGQYLFFAFFILILCLVLFVLLTRKGKNGEVELLFGCKVLEDLGEIGSSKLPLGNQKLRLLRCQYKNGEEFAIIEVTESMAASYNVSWVKLDSTILKNLTQLVSP